MRWEIQYTFCCKLPEACYCQNNENWFTNKKVVAKIKGSFLNTVYRPIIRWHLGIDSSLSLCMVMSCPIGRELSLFFVDFWRASSSAVDSHATPRSMLTLLSFKTRSGLVGAAQKWPLSINWPVISHIVIDPTVDPVC